MKPQTHRHVSNPNPLLPWAEHKVILEEGVTETIQAEVEYVLENFGLQIRKALSVIIRKDAEGPMNAAISNKESEFVCHINLAETVQNRLISILERGQSDVLRVSTITHAVTTILQDLGYVIEESSTGPILVLHYDWGQSPKGEVPLMTAGETQPGESDD